MRCVVLRWVNLVSVVVGILFTVNGLAATSGTTLDRIAAVVNDTVITESQLDQEQELFRQQMVQAHTPLLAADVLRQKVLQHMIDEQLQLQLAKKLGINPSDAELDAAIAQIAQENGLTVQQLQGKVQEQGMSYAQYRQQIHKQMTISQLQQHEVNPQVKISDQDITDVMVAAKTQPAQKDPLYHLQDMVVPFPETAGTQQVAAAEQRAQELIAKLHAGADFRQTVLASSTQAAPLQGGDLGWHKLNELPDLFAPYVSHLQPGEVAGPIRAPNGFHIIQLLEVKGGGPVQHQTVQTHARHILIKATPIEPDGVVKARLERLRDRILQGADFAQLATANSQDLGSASKGGDLGWATTGTFDPVFEVEMNKLQPGQISEPFKTQFGWHIVQVLQRKTNSDSQEYLRTQAKQMVGQRKYQEATENWLQQLRSQAYIKIF